MLTDLLLADLKSIFFLKTVLSLMLLIFLSCNTKNLFQRMNHLVFFHSTRFQNNTSVLHASGSLHDNVIAYLNLVVLRIKIIYFSYISKSYSNYHFHSISP